MDVDPVMNFKLKLIRNTVYSFWSTVGYYCRYNRCDGLVVSVPATRSTHPGFESRPGASPHSGLRGGISLCEKGTNKLYKTRPRLVVSKKKKKLVNQNSIQHRLKGQQQQCG